MAGGAGFAYRDDDLCCDGVRLIDVVEVHGTPTYVYSAASILERLTRLRAAFAAVPSLVCYAVKTNSNLSILRLLAQAGAGFDIVSGGELERLLRAGAAPERIVFAGVGKARHELAAAVGAGIGTFNIESLPEAELLDAVARGMGRTARVALRVNPGVQAGGHRYITTGTAAEKFGIPLAECGAAWERLQALPGLRPRGLHAHVGSQILDAATFANVAAVLADLAVALRAQGAALDEINLGGGFGIRYRDEVPPTPEAVAEAVLPHVRDLDVRLLLEPGRSIVGEAGALLTRVIYRKQTSEKTFLVVDAGMNDLVRPSLYGAWHEILPLRRDRQAPTRRFDVVGPICESGDFLARDRDLPDQAAGASLAVCNAGAYGFAMSSNYNSRPRAAEVLVADGVARLVRRRETFEDLVRAELEGSELGGTS